MFEGMINKLKEQFSQVNEKEDLSAGVENDVLQQLDRSEKLDNIDTVTFGLETDDGKIVKVYVNAEEGDEFEKALSAKLGEVDDIEEVLNELDKDFDIVDVVWPDDKDENQEEDEEDPEAEVETDGSEVLNQKVYKNEKDPEAKMEHLNYGEKVAMSIMEGADGNSIESRLTNATQLMVYHAILELGIPEIALNKSPYKASIVQGIKLKAIELSKDPQQKIALKMFVSKASTSTASADENDVKKSDEEGSKDAKDSKEVKDEPKSEPIKKDKKEDVKESAVEIKHRILTEAAEWSYTKEDDLARIACEHLKFSLTSEELERAVKALTNKDTIVLQDAEDQKLKVTISPRGINAVVKKVGDTVQYPMTAEQIKEFMEFAINGEEEEKPEEKEPAKEEPAEEPTDDKAEDAPEEAEEEKK